MLNIIGIILFSIGVLGLYLMKKKLHKNFNSRVLTALFAGLIFGGIMQVASGGAIDSQTSNFIIFVSIFSGIYMNLLKFIVIPLIFVSITVAIIDAPTDSKIAKNIVQIISVLLLTVAISAIIGIFSVELFNIDGSKIVESNATNSSVQMREESLASQQSSLNQYNFADFILAPVPTDLSFFIGAGATAPLSTVVFGMFLGYSVIQLRKRKPEKTEHFINFLLSLKEVTLSMVREILKLTPFGIFALMTIFMATSSLDSLGELTKFLIATYFAIILMYIIHLIILAIIGINPIKYAKKTWPVLVFGFGSRSSMAAMPLNIETQIEQLGNDSAIANLSATLGATIGQNGCAGIYPAMIATMAAPIYGIDINFGFLVSLIIVIVISSFGIAGVGGGATFAAIAVLSIMGFPIEIAATLAAIEPLLDMARTSLNISGAMVSGSIVSKIAGKNDAEVLNS